MFKSRLGLLFEITPIIGLLLDSGFINRLFYGIYAFWDLNIPEKSPLLSLGVWPFRTRSEGSSSAPLETTRVRGRGWSRRPERAPVSTHISGSSCGRESLSVRGCIGHSDKHAAKHGTRSGREQRPVRNEMTKPGASSFIIKP